MCIVQSSSRIITTNELTPKLFTGRMRLHTDHVGLCTTSFSMVLISTERIPQTGIFLTEETAAGSKGAL